MKYREIKPYVDLEPFIHTFWELKGDENDRQWERNFPDACPGLVIECGFYDHSHLTNEVKRNTGLAPSQL